ncbi:hypothetical protein [Nocardia tengchongensis]|uniref:hypothetical protein n=1 Tax=Nocardia tengchongensis TaxID=2055889 RepID=UPI0036929ECF
MPEILDTHVLCRTCSALIPDDPLLDFPAAECRDCDERPFCQDCEERVDDVHWTVDHGVLCTTCARRWSQCEYCERYTTAGEATVSGDIVCDTCHIDHYWRCSDCCLLSRYLRSVDTGEEVCRDCESQYRVCDDCDYLTANDDYCTSCSRDRRDDHIHDYSYKPAPYFHGQGPVFLGLELEIKTRSSSLQACAEIAADHLGDLGYLKEDGSIGYNAGFEIVTHPMSYEWAIDEFPWKMLRELRIRGAYVDDNVGIHVHVSRKGFDSAAHVYRWMKFFYRNESHAVRLARRRSDDWASFTPETRAGIAKFAKGERFGYGRYQAINVYPEETFEVRIFASSLHHQQVQAALAFIAASVEYTRTLTSGDVARRRGWEWTAFVTWVRAHPIYLPLLAEMEALACAS